jgi:hypothetical protein
MLAGHAWLALLYTGSSLLLVKQVWVGGAGLTPEKLFLRLSRRCTYAWGEQPAVKRSGFWLIVFSKPRLKSAVLQVVTGKRSASAAPLPHRTKPMIYYAIYLKGLHNSTGYLDVALESDELMKDYQNYLDMGIKTHKSYPIADPGKRGAMIEAKSSRFVVNLSEIMAISVVYPAPAEPPLQRGSGDIPNTVAF